MEDFDYDGFFEFIDQSNTKSASTTTTVSSSITTSTSTSTSGGFYDFINQVGNTSTANTPTVLSSFTTTTSSTSTGTSSSLVNNSTILPTNHPVDFSCKGRNTSASLSETITPASSSVDGSTNLPVDFSRKGKTVCSSTLTKEDSSVEMSTITPLDFSFNRDFTHDRLNNTRNKTEPITNSANLLVDFSFKENTATSTLGYPSGSSSFSRVSYSDTIPRSTTVTKEDAIFSDTFTSDFPIVTIPKTSGVSNSTNVLDFSCKEDAVFSNTFSSGNFTTCETSTTPSSTYGIPSTSSSLCTPSMSSSLCDFEKKLESLLPHRNDPSELGNNPFMMMPTSITSHTPLVPCSSSYYSEPSHDLLSRKRKISQDISTNKKSKMNKTKHNPSTNNLSSFDQSFLSEESDDEFSDVDHSNGDVSGVKNSSGDGSGVKTDNTYSANTDSQGIFHLGGPSDVTSKITSALGSCLSRDSFVEKNIERIHSSVFPAWCTVLQNYQTKLRKNYEIFTSRASTLQSLVDETVGTVQYSINLINQKVNEVKNTLDSNLRYLKADYIKVQESEDKYIKNLQAFNEKFGRDFDNSTNHEKILNGFRRPRGRPPKMSKIRE